MVDVIDAAQDQRTSSGFQVVTGVVNGIRPTVVLVMPVRGWSESHMSQFDTKIRFILPYQTPYFGTRPSPAGLRTACGSAGK